jgi:hypothetical protein
MKLVRMRRISPNRASRSARAYSAVRAMSMMRIRPVGPHDTRDFLKRLHAFSASCDVVDRQARHDDVE